MNQSKSLPPPPPPIRPRQTKTKTGVLPVAPPPQKRKKVIPVRRIHNRHSKSHRPVRRELSAGGVAVREEHGQWFVALLKTEHKRGSVWVLPKGHVEMALNESIPDAAKREVQEEVGLKDLSVRDQLGITRYAFQAEEALVKKTVHYFLIVTGQKQLLPQAEEGFIEAAWFPIDVAIDTLEYDTDQDMVKKAREKLLGVPASLTSVQKIRNRTIRVHT